MTAVDLAGQSKTPPPPANPPSRPPKTPSPPTKPPKRDAAERLADDRIFLAVAQLRVDLARPHKPAPPSKPPRKPTNTKPIRSASQNSRHGGREESPTPPRVAADSEGRAGLTPPGAVPFTLPPTPALPSFGDGPPRPGNPPPPPPQPFPPNPFPRPGLAWLPALMLPSLLLLAAIDYTAWAAWWI